MKQTQRYAGLTLLRKSDSSYPESPDTATLEAFENAYPKRPYHIRFDCPEFTSRCPITHQPDFGNLTIDYVPGKLCLESKALKLYLFSFRNHNTFHEEAVNRILEDIVKAIKPREITVTGAFNPRGGISITVTARRPEEKRRAG
jgi:7-cyano-7-deazaguanine reductase